MKTCFSHYQGLFFFMNIVIKESEKEQSNYRVIKANGFKLWQVVK